MRESDWHKRDVGLLHDLCRRTMRVVTDDIRVDRKEWDEVYGDLECWGSSRFTSEKVAKADVKGDILLELAAEFPSIDQETILNLVIDKANYEVGWRGADITRWQVDQSGKFFRLTPVEWEPSQGVDQ